MWNILSILLIVFFVYLVVREFRQRRIITEFLNDKDNIVKVNQIIQKHANDKTALDKIKADFNLSGSIANNVLSFVKRIN